ncbi:MAG: glycine betaine/L-proline ABC transporter ATP-binding protein, partial [Candidatus Pseudothioglobus sp.]
EDIILNPADDYVKAFVQDVNRSKVLRARTVMTKLDKFDKSSINPSSTYKFDEDTYIEDIVPKVLKDRSTIEVINKDGTTTGFITSDELSVALTKTK